MTRRTRTGLLLALAASAALLAIVEPAFALSAVPGLALVAALVCGAFPGERILARWRERRARTVRVRRPPAAPRPRPTGYVRPVGCAAAFALAMRPPPSGSAVR
jgi:hypothetical protein